MALSKDKRFHDKKDAFNDLSFGLISIILDDDSIREVKGRNRWNKNIDLARKAKEKLKDPKFILKQLRSIIRENTSSDPHVGKAEAAYKVLELFFQQSSSTVPKQGYRDEISNSLDDIERARLLNHIKGLEEALQMEVKDLKNENKQMEDVLKQKQDSLDQMHQSVQALKLQNEVVNSDVNMAAIRILDKDYANKVQGTHGLGLVDLETYWPPIPDSDIFNLEGSVWDFDSLPDFCWGDQKGEGSSNVDENCIVRGYTVFKRNADVLDKILEAYPNIISENFGAAHPDLQSYFMNSLAELYQNITDDQSDFLDQKEIDGMEQKVGDMERNGLQQLSWLKDMLVDVRKRKRLRELIDSERTRENEAKQIAENAGLELAKLEKKPRLK